MDDHDLFARFGGTRKMASILDEAPSTVQSWKANGRIPSHKQALVIDKGREVGIDVTAEEVVFPLGRPDELAPESDAA